MSEEQGPMARSIDVFTGAGNGHLEESPRPSLASLLSSSAPCLSTFVEPHCFIQGV